MSAALIGFSLPVSVPASGVVGGGPVEASAYPWLAAIGSPLFFDRPSGQVCGGALIAPGQVLTAAHCVDLARFLPQVLTVTFERSDLRSHGGVTVGVNDIRIHPDFHDTDFQDETAHHNDLAILTLDEAQPGPFVEIGAPRGDAATVLGWGATSEDDTSNTTLRAATVPLIPDATCATVYTLAFDPTDMLCAGSPEADTGEFDSGGPLLAEGRLIGITSWALGTARPGYPGVYTRPNPDF